MPDPQIFAKDAITDLLKVSFNLLIYSRQISSVEPEISSPMPNEDYWNPKFERYYAESRVPSPKWFTFVASSRIVEALLRLLRDLPDTSPSPLQPPLTYVLHNLINVPVNETLGLNWTMPYTGASSRGVFGDYGDMFLDADTDWVGSPLTRIWELCDQVLGYYIPYDPDNLEVRLKCRSEGVVLDELAVPLPIILARLAKANSAARNWMFKTLLPDDLYVMSLHTRSSITNIGCSGIGHHRSNSVKIFWDVAFAWWPVFTIHISRIPLERCYSLFVMRMVC